MSKFLGPIHYWLYDKIGNQEKLTEIIAKYAESNGWIESTAPYVKELLPLESVIDESNIHGWLQARISDAESRYASLIMLLEKSNNFDIEKILRVAFDFGKEHMVSSEADVMDVYEAFEDFFINGMPCDQVNVVVSQEPNKISWEMTQDMHASYWDGEDCINYYVIRKAVMDGMLAESNFSVVMNSPHKYSICRI